MNKEQALKDIQSILKKTGFYTGAIDGLIGWGSYSSLLNFAEKTQQNKQAAREIQGILADHRTYFGAIDGFFGKGSISGFNALIEAPALTDEMLKRIYKNCAPGFSVMINATIEAYNIKTKADLCAYLATCLHESAGFNDLREKMNYSALRLFAVFPKYFSSLSSAQLAVSKGPIAIAKIVYGGRMGNSKDNNDGYDFRGGGPIHLTGRDNYRLCSIGIGAGNTLVENPDLIIKPEYSVKSSLWFWKKNSCSGAANQGDFEKVCKIVNNGTNGLAERKALLQKAWSILP